ncbi:MAG: polymorphic toxin-type HINT domain-containing protein, partial [Pirellulales bacterium]
CELTVEDASGRRETIKPTGYHKFYSDTRKAWVSASQLDGGERLRGVNGPLTVIDIHRIPGVERVYNMTVEGQHVYRVSFLGALVHNECPPDTELEGGDDTMLDSTPTPGGPGWQPPPPPPGGGGGGSGGGGPSTPGPGGDFPPPPTFTVELPPDAFDNLPPYIDPDLE